MKSIQTRLKALLPQSKEDRHITDTLHTRKALISRSLIRSLHTEGDVILNTSGVLAAQADGDIVINAGGALFLNTAGDLHLNGGGGLIAAQQATVESGTVGVVIARSIDLKPGVKVLLSTRQALIIGVAVGIGYPLVRYLLQRFLPIPANNDEAEQQPFWKRTLIWFAWLLLRILVVAVIAGVIYQRIQKRIDPILSLVRRS